MIPRGPIVVVEDTENDALLLQEAFAKVGVNNEVKRLKNGEEVLHYLSQFSIGSDTADNFPCLLLLDLKLPGLSGFEVLERLRNQESLKKLPVVILSSSRESVEVNKAYDLGANFYFGKPGSFQDLLELARRIVDFWVNLNLRSS